MLKTLAFVVILGVAVAALVIAVLSTRRDKRDDRSLSSQIDALRAQLAQGRSGSSGLASAGPSTRRSHALVAVDAEPKIKDTYDFQGRLDASPMPEQPRRTTHRVSARGRGASVAPHRASSDPSMAGNAPKMHLPNPGATQGLSEDQARMLTDPEFIRAKTEALWSAKHRKTTPRKDPAQFHGHADPRLIKADKRRKQAYVRELQANPEKYDALAASRSTILLDDLIERMS